MGHQTSIDFDLLSVRDELLHRGLVAEDDLILDLISMVAGGDYLAPHQRKLYTETMAELLDALDDERDREEQEQRLAKDD